VGPISIFLFSPEHLFIVSIPCICCSADTIPHYKLMHNI
jgi:hypothetical protein